MTSLHSQAFTAPSSPIKDLSHGLPPVYLHSKASSLMQGELNHKNQWREAAHKHVSAVDGWEPTDPVEQWVSDSSCVTVMQDGGCLLAAGLLLGFQTCTAFWPLEHFLSRAARGNGCSAPGVQCVGSGTALPPPAPRSCDRHFPGLHLCNLSMASGMVGLAQPAMSPSLAAYDAISPGRKNRYVLTQKLNCTLHLPVL